jgi:uncharacterized protein
MNKSLKANGRVLITGAGGMTGRRLMAMLKESGYEVVALRHRKNSPTASEGFTWDIDRGSIDSGALEGVTHIIHLAGAGIADKRWSKKRKSEIVASRVKSARLLFDRVKEDGISLKCYISASATGIYEPGFSNLPAIENEAPAMGFLGETCRLWEESADLFSKYGVRTVRIRTGIVLAKEGGFIKRITPPSKVGLFAWFGSGKQFMPWIHIEDLCRIYLDALGNEAISGAYNAVAPEHITQESFMRTFARVKGMPALLTGIPSMLVRVALGEMAEMLLTGRRVSSAAIESAGFVFRHRTAEEALRQIVGRHL